jgi:hypothetical protein
MKSDIYPLSIPKVIKAQTRIGIPTRKKPIRKAIGYIFLGIPHHHTIPKTPNNPV